MDGVLLTFSEIITGAVGNNFNITGLGTGSTYSNSITSSGNTITLNIGETSADNDTSITPSYAYSGVSIKDANNNLLVNITTTVATDGISPKIVSRTMMDQDGNGYIDTIKLSMSEAIFGTGGITALI